MRSICFDTGVALKLVIEEPLSAAGMCGIKPLNPAP
jgi:hypothetical protein